jgi:hypothetical protein
MVGSFDLSAFVYQLFTDWMLVTMFLALLAAAVTVFRAVLRYFDMEVDQSDTTGF